MYYRTKRDGIVYIVTGGGGAPLYEDRHPELMLPGDFGETIHHFCIADVFEDRIDITAYRHDLTKLDAVSVPIPSPPPAPEPAMPTSEP